MYHLLARALVKILWRSSCNSFSFIPNLRFGLSPNPLTILFFFFFFLFFFFLSLRVSSHTYAFRFNRTLPAYLFLIFLLSTDEMPGDLLDIYRFLGAFCPNRLHAHSAPLYSSSQYLIYLRRIGLAFGSLHHLPHEGIKGFFLARLEFFDGFRDWRRSPRRPIFPVRLNRRSASIPAIR